MMPDSGRPGLQRVSLQLPQRSGSKDPVVAEEFPHLAGPFEGISKIRHRRRTRARSERDGEPRRLVASRRVASRQPPARSTKHRNTPFPLLFDRFIARAQSGGYVTRLRLLCA